MTRPRRVDDRAKAVELGVHLHYDLRPGGQPGSLVSNALFDVLNAVREGGSISRAAKALDASYRHTWGLLKQWEQTLGDSLIVWTRGQPARLTPFAERLVWAERRARTRVQPHVEALRADLTRMLAEAREGRELLLTVCASHDLALPLLQQHAGSTSALHLDIRFQGSIDSLRALSAGQCVVAGFHVPALRGAAPMFSKAMKPLLKPGVHKLIGCYRRQQGLMVRQEDAAEIRCLSDLMRRPLRFVNRQVGSGTRLLMDHLMREQRLDVQQLSGYFTHTELSHVAVAACVASGVADVGPGIEAAAAEFGLQFVPIIEEDYFLACLKASLSTPEVQRLRVVLGGAEWRNVLARLPGYAPASEPGKVLVMTAALPWWRFSRAKAAPGNNGGLEDDASARALHPVAEP